MFCQSSVAEQVWLCASLGTVPTRRQCVASTDCNAAGDAQTSKREAGGVFLWGCLELTGRFSLHLHVKWPGYNTAGE